MGGQLRGEIVWENMESTKRENAAGDGMRIKVRS